MWRLLYHLLCSRPSNASGSLTVWKTFEIIQRVLWSVFGILCMFRNFIYPSPWLEGCPMDQSLVVEDGSALLQILTLSKSRWMLTTVVNSSQPKLFFFCSCRHVIVTGKAASKLSNLYFYFVFGLWNTSQMSQWLANVYRWTVWPARVLIVVGIERQLKICISFARMQITSVDIECQIKALRFICALRSWTTSRITWS